MFHRSSLVAFLLAMLLAPTAAAQATPPSVATPSPVSDIGIDLLTEQQVPSALVTIMDGERTLDDVVANFADPTATAAQFRMWGWRRNVVRAFHLAEGTQADASKIDGIYISVQEFGSPADAREALDYIFDAHISGTDLQEIQLEPLGDYSRVLYGKMPYGNEVTFYVQHGDLVIRLSASSPTGDPRTEATVLVHSMLEP